VVGGSSATPKFARLWTAGGRSVASIRKRRGRFEVRWRDGGGQRSRTFTRKADADRFKVEVERQAQLGSLYEAEPVLFSDFLDGWLERFQQRVRPSTYARGVQALRAVPELGRWRVHEIRAAEVEDRIAAVGRRAPRQASIALQLLKQVFRSAEQRGHRVDVAIFGVRPPRHEEREPRFLTWSEVELLSSYCTEGRLVVFAALTGLRQGEMFGLRRGDLDLANRIVRVERSGRAGAFGKTKSGRKRVVHLTVRAAEVAAEQLGLREGGTYDLVFPSPAGRMWRKDNFMARVFRPAIRRAELDGLTFHDLRHTYASLMVAAGASPHAIAEQLGHRDARLVLQRYGHLYPGASRQAALDLDLYLEAASVGQAWGGGGLSDGPSEESPGNQGGAYRDRTGDLRLAKPALSQLS
jgi:integrase